MAAPSIVVEYVPLNELRPDPANPVERMRAFCEAFGAQGPVTEATDILCVSVDPVEAFGMVTTLNRLVAAEPAV